MLSRSKDKVAGKRNKLLRNKNASKTNAFQMLDSHTKIFSGSYHFFMIFFCMTGVKQHCNVSLTPGYFAISGQIEPQPQAHKTSGFFTFEFDS